MFEFGTDARPDLTDFSDANHDHEDAAGGGQIDLAAITDAGDAAGKDVGTGAGDVAAGDRGVTSGDDHDHQGGDGGALAAAAVTSGTFDASRIRSDGLSPLGIIASDLTLYVATDGDDGRTFAQAQSAGTPLASPGKALELLADKWIAPGVTVTIQLADGTYTLTDTLTFNHPQGRGLLLQGNTDAGTSNYILAQSGQIASTSGDDCILHVSGDVTARFPARSALNISGSTATPTDNNGYYYVTAVSYDGSKTLITLGGANSDAQMPDPTESCDGSTQQVTNIPWSHKVKLYKATGTVVQIATAAALSGLCIYGNDAAGSEGVAAAFGTDSRCVVDLDKVLVRNVATGLSAAYGSYFYAPNFLAQPGGDIVVADCTSSPGRGMAAGFGGYVGAYKGTVIGCGTGTYAAGGSHVDMTLGTWRTCDTDSSPAVNTVGSDNSYVAE